MEPLTKGPEPEGLTPSEIATRQEAFRQDLAETLNRHSAENGCNTPDFILADYLIECLRALDDTVNRRAKWYGRSDEPGQSS